MYTERTKDRVGQTPFKRLSLYLVSGAVVFGAVGGAKLVVEQLVPEHNSPADSGMDNAADVDTSAYCYVATNLPSNTTQTTKTTPVSGNQIEVTAVVPVQYESVPCSGPTY